MFRKANLDDINEIMKIIVQAQDYLKLKEIDQWQDGYPNREVIEHDIKNDVSYIIEKDGKVIATAMLSFDKEKAYDKIYGGKWLSDSEFLVIHRVAVDNNYKGYGIASEIIKEAEKLCDSRNIKSIKIDTHKENLSMQRLLEKNGFKYCGIIFLDDGSERIAFERLIK